MLRIARRGLGEGICSRFLSCLTVLLERVAECVDIDSDDTEYSFTEDNPAQIDPNIQLLPTRTEDVVSFQEISTI